eukprot:TRINITY_DN16218_c0_g2_i1.p1 TRINITY_DN16218_c0_g2~~TRINITY_DN16218_c0_g2_i1.p1  ORF type:complete len:535 (+),score=93.75 TRINITY_DN16218_c0_g2_i1:106-1710(+)
MKMLTTVAFALSLAVAHRPHRSDLAVEEHDAEVVKHEPSLERKKFKIFHINLGWECAALPPFGSGKWAAAHCKPGKFTGETDADGLPTWQEDNETKAPLAPPWTPNARPWNALVTSCQNTFLRSLSKWHASTPYDILTIDEMGNPGVRGLSEFLDRPEATLPDMVKTQQQLDPEIYGTLKNRILRDYGVFCHMVTNKVIGMQATFFRKSRLGEVDLALGFNFLSPAGGERPCSALFFVSKKTLVLNIHSVHFRKTLLASDAATQFGTALGTSIEAMGREVKADFQVGTSAANMLNFGTTELQTLFGHWVTAKLTETYEQCKQSPNARLDNIQGYCKVGNDDAFHNIRMMQNWKEWKIFAAGDFNDETMELSSFPILGQAVGIDPAQRKRTCCSDRDQNFKKVMSGASVVAENDIPRDGLHTLANKEYMEATCKYVPEGALDRFMQEHQEINPMNVDGANQILGDGTTNTKSSYPFPSDIIVSNQPGSAINFPSGYAQRMSTITHGYESDPGMPGGGYKNGMISDHDPIERFFQR